MFIDIRGCFIDLVKNKAGTHTLQRLIECLDEKGLQLVLETIKGHEVELSKDEFATHFMQKLIQLYPNYDLICTFLANFKTMACDKFSIVVLKSLLKICSQNQYLRYQFFETLLESTENIVFDEYGH